MKKKRKPLKIVLWDHKHEHEIVLSLNHPPQIGSNIYIDEDSDFAKASGSFQFKVRSVSYWLNEREYNDECSVIISPLTKAELKSKSS